MLFSVGSLETCGFHPWASHVYFVDNHEGLQPQLPVLLIDKFRPEVEQLWYGRGFVCTQIDEAIEELELQLQLPSRQ